MNQRPRIADQGRGVAVAAGAPGGSRAPGGPRAPSSPRAPGGPRAPDGSRASSGPRAPGGPRGPREWVSAAEATKLLGVKRETLYAYASRGLVRSASGAGPRDRVYNRSDVDRLRARSQARAGHGAVAASALRWGEPVLETSVGTITPQGPAYRGQPAVELARQGASFESVCSLLWAAPAPAEADPVDRRPSAPAEAEPVDRRPSAPADVEPVDRRPNAIADVDPAARRLGVPVAPLRALLRPGAEPFDGILLTAGALAAAERHAEPSLADARARAPALVRRLAAACALGGGADAVSASLEADGAARALLVALGGRTTAPAVAAMNEALIVVADHELNPSTFAARVAASAGGSLPACVLAALTVLGGSLHGGVTAHVESLVDEVARPERSAAVVGEWLARGGSLPGFGHPLYREGDPRAARLLEVALRVGGKARGVRVLASIVDAMALVARERPTVDVGLVALAAALGLPRGAPLAIFACGRAAGWMAHALEQRAAGFVLRPRARYVGV